MSATTLRSNAASSAQPQAVRQLPAWTLERELYRGACHAVYAARPRHGAFGGPADYAVKLLLEEAPGECQAQLRREAYLGRHLQHPHLVSVFSARFAAEESFLVMPLLRGANGQQVLAAAKRFSLGRAVWMARQAADALSELHECGWIHGDVKPANLMISREGHVTLIDLGFARKASPPQRVAGPLTASVAYAAPELFTGESLTCAADIYSLAIMLFEMIAGGLPFAGQTAEQLANAHVSHTPLDIRELDPLVPQPVAWLLRRALAKQSLRRPSAAEMRDSLAACEIELLHGWSHAV